MQEPQPQPSPWRRLALWGIVLPVLAGVAMVLLATTKGDVWKAKAVDRVNEMLHGEVSVDSISLSWWNGFPNISVDLAHIALESESRDTLVACSRLGLELDFWSLWGDEPQLQAVVLEDGFLSLRKDAQGRFNLLDVLATPEDSSRTTSLSLSSFEVRDMAVTYRQNDGIQGRAFVEQLVVRPSSSSGPWSWQLRAPQCAVQGPEFPVLHPVSLENSGTFDVSTGTGFGEFLVHGIAGHWDWVSGSNNQEALQLRLDRVTQRKIEQIWADAPWKNMVTLEQSFKVDLSIEPEAWAAQWSTSSDAFQLAPQLTGLTMALQGVGAASGNVQSKGGRISWQVSKAEAQGVGWDLQGSFESPNNHQVHLQGQFNLDASTPFDAWIPGIGVAAQSALPSGGSVTVQGQANWNPTKGIHDVEATAKLQDLQGQIDGIPYRLSARSIAIHPETCRADSIEMEWGENRGEVDVLTLNTTNLYRGGPIKGELQIRAKQLDVGALLNWWDMRESQPTSAASLLPPGSDLSLHIESEKVHWDALHCTDVLAKTTLTHNKWNIHSAQLNGLQGRAHVEGALQPGRAGWMLSLRGTADDISLPLLFSTYGNFGQSLLRHEHLSGAISTAGNLTMSWGLDGAWHGEHFTASLQTTINHGRLQDLEVFDDISDYLQSHRLMAPLVDPEDLRNRLKDVSFEEVTQRVDVRAQEVILPMTTIESTAMNVTIEGIYRFDETMDYTMGFALRDLRASAVDDVGVMEDDGLGNQVFLKMTGPVSSPEYAYDRDAAREHRRKAIEEEKTRIKEALKTKDDQKDKETPTPSFRDRLRVTKTSQQEGLLDPDDEDYL